MSRLFINKSSRSGRLSKGNVRSSVSPNNNVINLDGSQFSEKDSLNRTFNGSDCSKSPLKMTLQRHKSNPLPDTDAVTCDAPVRESPRKIEESVQQKSIGKFLRFLTRKRKTPTKDASPAAPPKLPEINLSDLSEEINVAELLTPQKIVRNQIYEQSINKHGDVVEYAVPYNERIVSEEDVSHSDEMEFHPAFTALKPVKVTDLDKSTDASRSLDQS